MEGCVGYGSYFVIPEISVEINLMIFEYIFNKKIHVYCNNSLLRDLSVLYLQFVQLG